jgi:hypothetical protein
MVKRRVKGFSRLKFDNIESSVKEQQHTPVLFGRELDQSGSLTASCTPAPSQSRATAKNVTAALVVCMNPPASLLQLQRCVSHTINTRKEVLHTQEDEALSTRHHHQRGPGSSRLWLVRQLKRAS